jgi:hypothetical protein
MTDEEKTAAEKAAAEKAAAEKAAAEKTAAEKAAAEKEAAEKAAKGNVSDKEVDLRKEVMEKKGKIKTLTAEIEALNKKFEGIDPAKVRELLDAQKKAEEAELERKGDFDRLKQRMADEHKSEMAKKDAELEDLKGRLSKSSGVIEELTVGQAFGNSPYIREELVLTPAKARIVYGAHFDIEDGKIVGYDKPRGASERTKLVDARGESIPFEDAMKKLVDGDPDKERLLKAKGKPGASSSTTAEKGKENAPELRGAARITAALAARAKVKK